MRLAIGLASLIAVCVWALAGPAEAAEAWVDDFESYDSDAKIQAAWVPSTENATTHVYLVGYDSAKSMQIAYHNGLSPWWTNVVFTFDTPQDWTNFRRLTLRYMGQDGNSGEDLVIQIKNADGEYMDGPWVTEATKTYEWHEYSMDISGWGFLGNVTQIEIHLPARDYGAGNLYIDRMTLDTFPPTIDDFETYAGHTELRGAWSTTPNNFISLQVTGSPDGDPHSGNQYLRSDYLDSFAPYDGIISYYFIKEQDWSGYKTLTLWYRGRDALYNARQNFQVQLKDQFGGYFFGPEIESATQCTADPLYCEWQEYVMGIESWAERAFAQEVHLMILGVPDYGNGRFYIDKIELSENPPVSVEPESWSSIKVMFR